MKKNRMRKIISVVYRNVRLTLEEMKRELLPPSIPINKDNKVYIHLGCGEINASGFINVDAIPYSHIHYVQEINDLSIFPNRHADLVYASHCLEHISHRDLSKVLREWYRVLKEGGILRLSVPDFDKLIEVYSAEEKETQTIIMPLMGGQDYDYNFHKTVFNEKYLAELLLSAGFRKVSKWDPQEVKMHSFDDWANKPIIVKGKKYWISLNLEAIK